MCFRRFFWGDTNNTRARFKSAVKIVGVGDYQKETKKTGLVGREDDSKGLIVTPGLVQK